MSTEKWTRGKVPIIKWCDLVWMDGELVEWKDAKEHISSVPFHYGIGIFEGIRGYSGKDNLYIFRLKEHVDRLFNSAKIYSMKIPFSKETIQQAIIEIVKKNNFHDLCYIRPIVYRGLLPTFGVTSALDAPVKTAILVCLRQKRLGTSEFERGKTAIISSWRRFAPDSMPSIAKCVGNYANGLLAVVEAKEKNVDYPILLDHRGFVSEGPGQNIFIVSNGKVITPPLIASILKGITRDTIITLARDLGYETLERDITVGELYTADEVFVCGTGTEVASITNINGREIGTIPGLITRKIAEYYERVVNSFVPEHRDWLTTVY